MDTDVFVPIIITSFTSFAALIGYIAKVYVERNNISKPTKLDLYHKQLINVLEPMIVLLERSGADATDENLSALRDIIFSNYSITDPQIITEYYTTINTKKLNDLRVLVDSHFNYTRKLVSYPFDKAKIGKELLVGRITATMSIPLNLLAAAIVAIAGYTLISYIFILVDVVPIWYSLPVSLIDKVISTGQQIFLLVVFIVTTFYIAHKTK